MPSTALADFVRCRDLTCRFPGCDHPAIDCDLDHTIPYAQGGPTHAGNLKCYCRTHHCGNRNLDAASSWWDTDPFAILGSCDKPFAEYGVVGMTHLAHVDVKIGKAVHQAL